MNAQQLNALPRMSSSQVASYPQQTGWVPAAAQPTGIVDFEQILGPMITLIMMVMIMRMMTKMMEGM